MLATMVLAACSSDDTTEPVVKRGMVLKANVEDTDTRATITDNEGKWKFAFAKDDKVNVGNDKVESYYTFTNDGTVFTSTDAKQTTEAATWCAFFPREEIDLRNQSGDFADVAKNYALAGATATPTTGSDGLTVTMKAKAAVLCIVGVNKDERLDINVKTDGDKCVSGLTAVKNSAGFKVDKSDTKVSLLSKQGAGVYYVVVPAGVKLSVYNGETLIKTTKDTGLNAGKYYTLKTGKTEGTENATINGKEVKKSWVQLWAGGPKFAEENVAEENVATEMTWYDAAKTDDDYVWGKNWRTPTKEELTFVYANQGSDGLWILTPRNTKAEVTVQDGVTGILYTGIQPGYTDRTIFFPVKDDGFGYYWTTTSDTNNDGMVLETMCHISGIFNYRFYPARKSENTKHLVRPVLAE